MLSLLETIVSSTVILTFFCLFNQIFTNASRIIRSAVIILTFAAVYVKWNFRLFEAVVALDPNEFVPVLMGHRSFCKLFIEEGLEFARVAHGLPTEGACDVMLNVGIVARAVERMSARKKNDA